MKMRLATNIDCYPLRLALLFESAYSHALRQGKLGDLYLLTRWLACLYGRIQSPRPDVMPDQSEGIMRVAGFGFARIEIRKPVSKKFIA